MQSFCLEGNRFVNMLCYHMEWNIPQYSCLIVHNIRVLLDCMRNLSYFPWLQTKFWESIHNNSQHKGHVPPYNSMQL